MSATASLGNFSGPGWTLTVFISLLIHGVSSRSVGVLSDAQKSLLGWAHHSHSPDHWHCLDDTVTLMGQGLVQHTSTLLPIPPWHLYHLFRLTFGLNISHKSEDGGRPGTNTKLHFSTTLFDKYIVWRTIKRCHFIRNKMFIIFGLRGHRFGFNLTMQDEALQLKKKALSAFVKNTN